ncbi:NADP-binding protein [Dacryopinax primogenitus]|uniref:NADP-binding protein n=1 Tax=Dacryopinax primogenitus (strain DJM 731) TaxID=1858805 RepID=M5FXY0_DACPD|nr:NADP-binding protein [Dacryopinax primogenitus]EJU01379.1 NADP-binding protein [Dacryopinax primogenitus]
MVGKIIVVTGSTGNQGRAVITVLLKRGVYRIRGLTRNVESPVAKELASQGVEMVSGHLLDKDSLIKSFAGAYASSLPSATELSNGKYTTHVRFDEKTEIDKYMKAIDQPGVVVHTGAFAENVLNFDYLKRDIVNPDQWHISIPITRPHSLWPLTYVGADLGPAVVSIIDKWDDPVIKSELSEKPLVLVVGTIDGVQMAETVKRVSGKQCDFVTIPKEMTPDSFILPYKFADDGFYAKLAERANPPILDKLGIKLHGFEDYVKDKIVTFMSK